MAYKQQKVMEIIADALFDSYRGYNEETISWMRSQSQYQREAQAKRVLDALDMRDYKVVKK